MTIKAPAAAAALSPAATAAVQARTITEIAAGDDRFPALVAAVTAAGLAETLSGPGPFTVCAPVNEAFAALPAGTVETLLRPGNKGQRTGLLLDHVDDRTRPAAGIPAGSDTVRPVLADARRCISDAGGAITIADGTGPVADLVIAHIQADNGVIHAIDKVPIPGTRPPCH